MTNRKQATELLESLIEKGVSHQQILEWMVNNYLSGDQAVNALQLLDMEMFDHHYNDSYNDTFYDHEDDVELDDVE
jgi:uncharacterized protein YbaP (TraB family)